MKLKLLGSLSGKIGKHIDIKLEGERTIGSIIEELIPNDVELRRDNPNLVIFINGVEFHMIGEYDAKVTNTDEVVILPAAHGGSSFCLAMIEDYTYVIPHTNLIVVKFRKACLKNIEYVYLVALQTYFARQNNEMLAKKPEMDFLLRLAQHRQIAEAINTCGGIIDIITVIFGSAEEMGSIQDKYKININTTLNKETLINIEKSAMLVTV